MLRQRVVKVSEVQGTLRTVAAATQSLRDWRDPVAAVRQVARLRLGGTLRHVPLTPPLA